MCAVHKCLHVYVYQYALRTTGPPCVDVLHVNSYVFHTTGMYASIDSIDKHTHIHNVGVFSLSVFGLAIVRLSHTAQYNIDIYIHLVLRIWNIFYIHTYTYVYIHIYIHMYDIYIYICICRYIFVYIHVNIWICTYVYMYIFTLHTSIHVYMYVYKYIQIYTYM